MLACHHCGTPTERVPDGEWTRWVCPACDRVTHREFGGAPRGSVLWYLRRAIQRSIRSSLASLHHRLAGTTGSQTDL